MIPLGLVVGVLAGAFRTARPLRWPREEPWDPSGIPFWPFVLGGLVIGLAPLVSYVLVARQGESRFRDAARRYPGSLIVNAQADRRTAAALDLRENPLLGDGSTLLIAVGAHGMAIEVYRSTGSTAQTLRIGRARLRAASVRERSTFAALGRDVWVTIERADGLLVEVPFAVLSEDFDEPSNQLLDDFAGAVAQHPS